MKSYSSPILSLIVCSVLLFGSTECTLSTGILPSPATLQKSSMSTHSPNSTLNASTVHVTHITSVVTSLLPNKTSVFTSMLPNKTSVFTSVLPNKTSVLTSALPNKTANHSIIISTSYSINSSVHNSSIYMTLTSVIMTSSAGNGSIHNSTIHPTPLPTHSINMTSTAVHNASSHVHPTMTPSPSPTSSVVPTSSIPPTTPPPLPKGKYFVKNSNGSKCLLLWLSLEFTLTYKSNSGNKLQTTVKMPSNGTADGTCEQSLSSIRVTWPYYSFEAFFQTAKDANGRWNTLNVTVTAQTMNNTDFLNATGKNIQQSVTNQRQLEWLSGQVGRSLNCSKEEKLTTDSMVATIVGLRIQPFEVKHDDFSKQSDTCSSAPTSTPTSTPKPSTGKKSKNTVAIAVGCSLAALVLIVVIGYFIGKRVRRPPGPTYRKL